MILFTNNAVATLASGISAGATAIALTTGQGALFPSPSGGNYFYATLTDASNNIEIVKCTSRAGDTLTVVRGQDNTSALAYLAGDQLSLRAVAAALQEMQTPAAGSITAAMLAANAVTTTKILDANVTTPKIADGAISAAKLASGAVAGQLGFTPVRQGGSDTIMLSWASPYISPYVNGVLLGSILPLKDDGNPAMGGYRGRPREIISSPTTLGFTHVGKLLLVNTAGVTITAPLTSSVGFGEGVDFEIINFSGGNIFIAPAGGADIYRAANGISATHTLLPFGRANLIKANGDSWIINGENLT